MKTGDTVRYLNAVGGGIVRRIEGKIAYVEEDGFETPVLVKDLVVVMPAGYEQKVKNANIMFDQGAFDQGKAPAAAKAPAKKEEPKQEAPLPVEETDYGNRLTLTLAFEPLDIKRLSTTKFAAVLVNDSNYFVSFVMMRKGDDDTSWTILEREVLNPNEYFEITQIERERLNDFQHIALQAFAFKMDKPFQKQMVVNFEKKLNLSKFYKLHCFRESRFFDTPVIEFPIVDKGAAVAEMDLEPERIKEAITTPANLKELKDKYASPKKGKTPKGGDNPHKLLPLIEVDLHIDELTDSTKGLSNSDMLSLQLNTVKETMARHSRRIGQKIVFIHGKGEGVLRKEVWALLKKLYPKAELQDASFREYGFGATLVTIH